MADAVDLSEPERLECGCRPWEHELFDGYFARGVSFVLPMHRAYGLIVSRSSAVRAIADLVLAQS